jgi:NAD(P)-dependent dehydrogenase (short-subunit alcohol dehydrogenase family)
LQLGTLSSRPAAASVSDAVGQTDDLLVLELDITSPASAVAAVESASERFGRIDVLLNNAGNFFAGFFEKLSPAQFEAQLTTNLLGPLNVTRAVLPLMRKQRSGHVVTISSTEGIVGQEFCSAYAASKFGLEGWMESLRFEVEPFGIQTTIVEPGFFRTDLLTKESTAYADLSIDDYAERTAQTRPPGKR